MGVSLQEAEQSVLGTDHAAAGAAVARKWNLPAVLLNAIEHHHQPLGLSADVDVPIQKTVAIVHVADMLADKFEIGRGIESAPETVDEEVWQLLEIDLDSCRELLDSVLEEVNTFCRIFEVRGRSKRSAARPQPQLNDPSGAQNGSRASAASPPVQSASASEPMHPMMVQFARFTEAGKQLALLAGLEDLLPNIAAQAMNLLSADAAHVLIPQTDALIVVGAAGFTYLKDKQLPVDGSLAGWVFKVGEKSVVSNIERTQPCWEKKFFTVAGFRAHLIVPLEWAGKRLAVLCIHHRQERAWSPQEISLIDMFVGLAAVALENARLYQEAEHRANALEGLNKQLAEALHVKSRFLTTVSHELRSPLTVITGYANLIAEETFGPLPAKMSEPVDKIIKHGNGLMSLINYILEVSEMDAGSFTLHRDCFDLRELLDDVSILATGLLGNKQVIFETDYEPSFSPIVTDRKRLRQILGHLLDNAAKFTREGKIVLRARIIEGEWEIVVEDTGIGIDAEQQKIIFDGFRQVEQEDNRRFEGMGLGLYLARRLTDLLGGTIAVESRIGEGTRFCVRMPRGEISPSAVDAAH
jgi:signal transduction histidine kinase